jgi:hypothetical protein
MVFIWRETNESLKVNPHLHSMLGLGMSEAVPPLPPYTFLVFPETTLPLCPQKYGLRIFMANLPQYDAG